MAKDKKSKKHKQANNTSLMRDLPDEQLEDLERTISDGDQ